MLSSARAGCRCALVAVVVASCATAASAASPPDSIPVVTGALDLGRALRLASRHEPGRLAANLRVAAAGARVGDASRPPNPVLGASAENFGGGLGAGSRELTVTVGQTLELGGDRASRRAAAEAEHRLAMAEASIVGREGLALAAERFIAAWSLQERLRRLREGEALSALAVRAATERHLAGASPRLEILRAESRALAQAVERGRAESELASARRDLATSWGATEATFDTLVAPGPPRPDEAPPAFATEAGAPELARAAASEALAAARVREAGAARTPDVAISAGVRRLEEVPGTGFVAGVEVALPLWNRGGGALAAARRELEAAATDRRAAARRLEAALASAAERVRAASAAHDTLRLRVLPARERLVDELLHGYRAGRSSYLDLAAEQAGLLETELARVDAEADLWRARLWLELLAGAGHLTPKEER